MSVGLPCAQFVGHDADRTELARDVEPGLALNATARLPTRPCAAPPLRMFRLFIELVFHGGMISCRA